MNPETAVPQRLQPKAVATQPIVALDYSSADAAFSLVDRLTAGDFFKVGLQLYTAEGPAVVQRLKKEGRKVFLDLKLHDIPNTVAGAVRSAAELGVDLLTIHASGGRAMMEAAAAAAAKASGPPQLLGVTIMTSLRAAEVEAAWGRESVDVEDEVLRLARLCAASGLDGVVASVHEIGAIRTKAPELRILTPGIRLAGDAAGDQARVATPAQAAEAGADYIVIGRSVSAADDPAAAFRRVLSELQG